MLLDPNFYVAHPMQAGKSRDGTRPILLANRAAAECAGFGSSWLTAPCQAEKEAEPDDRQGQHVPDAKQTHFVERQVAPEAMAIDN